MILVTGATGFIGTAFVKALVASGEKPRILVRNASTERMDGAETVEGDLLSIPSLENATKGVNAVVHLAGLVSYSATKSELFATNVAGTLNLLNACKKTNVKRFVFASSVAVYGKHTGPISEDTPTRPLNDYGNSKLVAESYVMESGMECIILRFAPVYGAGSKQWMENIKLLDGGFPVPATKNKTHVVSVGNATGALMLALTGPSGTYNIADAEPIGFTDFAERIVRLLGKEPKAMPLWLVKLGATFKGLGPYVDVLTQERQYSIKETQEKLGYKPVDDFEDEADRMVKWYLETKELEAG